MRNRPRGAAVMYQQWCDLLFLHWRYPADAIQATLPPGLFVDTHEGHAYLGVVPFVMRDVRPRFLPPVPGLSNFLELNLRTYVHDAQGIPGVWFYSLDANQRIAVEIARRLFHLPYERARMTMRRSAETITFTSQRLGRARGTGASTLSFRPHGAGQIAVPGSLEFFLGERYRLYSSTPSGLRRGAVWHTPYPLHAVDVTAYDEELFVLNRFAPTERSPDHAMYSPGVDVTIFPLERVHDRAAQS
jgi:uncharacterized protein YqjF (DUF2071 family)